MEEGSSAFKISTGKPLGKISIESTRRIDGRTEIEWILNKQISIRETGFGSELGLLQNPC